MSNLKKVGVSAIAFFGAIPVGTAISEVTLGRAGAAATPLIWALLIPCLVAIWYRLETPDRILAAAIGSVGGLGVWAFGHVVPNNPFLVGAVTSSSFLASGTLAYFVCRENSTQSDAIKSKPETAREKTADPTTFPASLGPHLTTRFQELVDLGRSMDNQTKYMMFNSIAIAAQKDTRLTAEQRASYVNLVRRAFEIDGEKMPD